jgi:hypothetical protein
MPEGVSRHGVFGNETADVSARAIQSLPASTRNYAMLAGVVLQTKAKTKNVGRPRAVSNSMANVTKLELSKGENEQMTIDGADSDSSIVSQGIKATTLPKPEYPRDVKTNGAVHVEVTLDAAGNIVSTKAVSGDKAFYAVTEAAAKNVKFEIPKLPFEIAKITGVIAYNFAAKTKTVTVAPKLENVRVETKPNKYHSSVKALIERLKNKQTQQPSADEAKFIKDGKAEIVVRLKQLRPETVAELKKLGFEMLTEITTANAVVGRIAIEKIAALAEIEQVTFISPQNR